jgi:hypothetical protein
VFDKKYKLKDLYVGSVCIIDDIKYVDNDKVIKFKKK